MLDDANGPGVERDVGGKECRRSGTIGVHFAEDDESKLFNVVRHDICT